MNSLNGVPNKLSPDEVFEQAVARLEAGEAIETIIASYPTADGEELRDFLTIVQATQQIRTGPIPQPSATQRRKAKQNFLAAAAELRAERTDAAAQAVPETDERVVASETTADSTPTANKATSGTASATTAKRSRQATRGRAQSAGTANWWQNILQSLQSIFTVRTLRLAPLIMMIAVVLLSTSTLVTVAQSAVPGDLTYSLKQWIRKHELELAPADQREIVRQMQEMELAEDVRRAAMRADTNATVIQAEDTQVFYGRNGRVLRIGGLTVLDRYQPDANQESFDAMTIEGDLLPGALVRLNYQIMPGQSETVQGISLAVIEPPDETTAATEPDVSDGEPTAVPAAEPTCSAELPEDWVVYQVRPGDNLTFIANRGDISVGELMEANCLEGETIVIGTTLFVPAEATEPRTGAPTCDAEIPAGWGEYEVQVGDNLSQIADRTDTTVDEIKTVNCLTSDTILIGATLLVPEQE